MTFVGSEALPAAEQPGPRLNMSIDDEAAFAELMNDETAYWSSLAQGLDLHLDTLDSNIDPAAVIQAFPQPCAAQTHSDGRLPFASYSNANDLSSTDFASMSPTMLKSSESWCPAGVCSAEGTTSLKQLLSAGSAGPKQVSPALHDGFNTDESMTGLSSDQFAFQDNALLAQSAAWESNNPFGNSNGPSHQPSTSGLYHEVGMSSFGQARPWLNSAQSDGTNAGTAPLPALEQDHAPFVPYIAENPISSAPANAQDTSLWDRAQMSAHGLPSDPYCSQFMMAPTGISDGFAAGQVNSTSYDVAGRFQGSFDGSSLFYTLPQDPDFTMAANAAAPNRTQSGSSDLGYFAAEHSALQPVSPDYILSSTPDFSLGEDMGYSINDRSAQPRNNRLWRCSSFYGIVRVDRAQAAAAKDRIERNRQGCISAGSKLYRLAQKEHACHARVERMRTAESRDASSSRWPPKQAVVAIQQARRRGNRKCLEKFEGALVEEDGLQMALDQRRTSSYETPRVPLAPIDPRPKSFDSSAYCLVDRPGRGRRPAANLPTPPSAEPRNAAARFGNNPPKKQKTTHPSSTKTSSKKIAKVSSKALAKVPAAKTSPSKAVAEANGEASALGLQVTVGESM
jgi:hypothetical protein